MILLHILDLKKIMNYLELDHEMNLINNVCEDCCDKLLSMEKFKRKCLAARIKFNERCCGNDNQQINDNKIEYKGKQPSKYHQCFFCHEIINGITEYRIHKKSCLIKEVKCTVKECTKSFMSQSGFNTHMNFIHGIAKTSKYTCINCRTNYQMTAIEFQEHMNKCSKNDELSQEQIQCDICKIMCNNLENYVSHKMSHDTKNLIKTTDDNGRTFFRKKEKNNFVCDLCGKLFANSRNIRKHKLNVHLVNFDGVLFSCDLCAITKPTKRLLYKHMKSVHILKPTPCEVCGKVYRTRELWQKHSLIHNDLKKNHVCMYCQHKPRFLCKSALQKHLKASHGECAIINKYQCDFKTCEASYASEINLNKHKLRVHGYL
ncbi:zinc finger protein 90-like isoform X2 [Chironomus tepperi]|uniref:zinc finger protein 90-like isoform X2 n=1 Tax=Chironomus tepperi TaxID=113505 RepID=UPI00391F93D8